MHDRSDDVDLLLAEFLAEREANPATPVDTTLIRVPARREAYFRQLLETVALCDGELPGGRPAHRVIADRYELLRRLGGGGLGDAWLAIDRILDCTVAVQILAAGTAPGWEGDGVREARVLATLDHPGVVRVLDAGLEGATGYLVTELVPGTSLEQTLRAMRALGHFPTGQDLARVLDGLPDLAGLELETRDSYFRCIARLFAGVARALEAAHELGVVHGALHPGSVLLRPGGRAMVRDFGLHVPSLPVVEDGDEASPRYGAPEQSRGGPAAHRAGVDVFRLGALLYEAVTLEPAFPPGADADRVPDPRRAARDVPHELADVCLKAMHPDPEGRYAALHELAQDLELVAAGEAPAASRGRIGPFSPLRFRLGVRRRRVALFSAAAAGLALAAAALLLPLPGAGRPEHPPPAVVWGDVRTAVRSPSVLQAFAVAGNRVAAARLSLAADAGRVEGSTRIFLPAGEHRLRYRTELPGAERLVLFAMPPSTDLVAELGKVLAALDQAHSPGAPPGVSLPAARGVIDRLRARDGAALPWSADQLLGERRWHGPGLREEHRLKR